MDNKIVGHKTMKDGSHLPLYEDEAERIMGQIRKADKKRKKLMPTEQDAIKLMNQAYIRLKEFGWKDAIYCPKDGSAFDVIENGSTGVHNCHYEGEWPSGYWWVSDGRDLYPSRPCLFRIKGKLSGKNND